MKAIYFIVFFALFILFNSSGYCYWENVHEKITQKTIDQTASSLNNSLMQLGLSNGVSEELKGNPIRKWIEEGSIKEDEHVSQSVVVRYLNHFYDPLTGLGLTDAPYFGTSSYSWASKDVNNACTWT